MFTAQDVATLRARTGAGMMDCKNALQECEGNMDKAVDYLREKGIAKAAKKADRIAAEGVVQSYIHMGGKIGVLVEVNCETDFVARSEGFVQFTKNIAMQIAASNPKYVSIDEVDAADLEREREIAKTQAMNEGKPEAIAQKMVENKIKKYYAEVCLLEQPYVKNPSQSIQQLLTETILTIGEKISIRRFVRYEMGEGLEKRQDNFAEEVMGQMKK